MGQTTCEGRAVEHFGHSWSVRGVLLRWLRRFRLRALLVRRLGTAIGLSVGVASRTCGCQSLFRASQPFGGNAYGRNFGPRMLEGGHR